MPQVSLPLATTWFISLLSKIHLMSFLRKKAYTEKEIAYCELFDNAILRYASTWAAKEAVYKAVKQLDISAIGWKKIEIIRDKIAGRPVRLCLPEAKPIIR